MLEFFLPVLCTPDHSDHSTTVYLACFDPGHSEDEAIAHQHDQEGEQGTPDLPERGIARLPVPRVTHIHLNSNSTDDQPNRGGRQPMRE